MALKSLRNVKMTYSLHIGYVVDIIDIRILYLNLLGIDLNCFTLLLVSLLECLTHPPLLHRQVYLPLPARNLYILDRNVINIWVPVRTDSLHATLLLFSPSPKTWHIQAP